VYIPLSAQTLTPARLVVEAYLAITYTPTYPDTVPIFNVEPVEGDGELSSAELAKIMEAITEAVGLLCPPISAEHLD
jgi:hypothetical protein